MTSFDKIQDPVGVRGHTSYSMTYHPDGRTELFMPKWSWRKFRYEMVRVGQYRSLDQANRALVQKMDKEIYV